MCKVILLLAFALPLRSDTTVTLLHFSDYHSHALPFYSEEGERGGIARAIAYAKAEKQRGALVFSGGDTMNLGSPAWSDKYECAEWPWWNGILDAMALGNHDADYGRQSFEKCRRSIRYPLLSANTSGFESYRVLKMNGIRIGVFALAGQDFLRLMKTPGFVFGDPVAAARDVVRRLRDQERVDAVVLIGHQHAEADYALARAVPGIDLIFGSHSHLKRELVRIPETSTWFISPSQYLSYISRVELTLGKNRIAVRGGLIPIDDRLGEDGATAKRVRDMQRELERDPKYAELFTLIGTLDAPLTIAELAQRTLEVMRQATNADVAISTSSSFRRPLPTGKLTMELLRGSLPYDNELVVCTMNAAQLQRLFDAAASRKGTDAEPYVSGDTKIDSRKTYRVATTDYLANVAYKDVFDCDKKNTGMKVRTELRRQLTKN